MILKYHVLFCAIQIILLSCNWYLFINSPRNLKLETGYAFTVIFMHLLQQITLEAMVNGTLETEDKVKSIYVV